MSVTNVSTPKAALPPSNYASQVADAGEKKNTPRAGDKRPPAGGAPRGAASPAEANRPTPATAKQARERAAAAEQNAARNIHSRYVNESSSRPAGGTRSQEEIDLALDGIDGLRKSSVTPDAFNKPKNEGFFSRGDKSPAAWEDSFNAVGGTSKFRGGGLAKEQIDVGLLRHDGSTASNKDIDNIVDQHAAKRTNDKADPYRTWTADQQKSYKTGLRNYLRGRRDQAAIVNQPPGSVKDSLPALREGDPSKGEPEIVGRPKNREERIAVRKKLDKWEADELAKLDKRREKLGMSKTDVRYVTAKNRISSDKQTYMEVLAGRNDRWEPSGYEPQQRKAYLDHLAKNPGDISGAASKVRDHQGAKAFREKGTSGEWGGTAGPGGLLGGDIVDRVQDRNRWNHEWGM